MAFGSWIKKIAKKVGGFIKNKLLPTVSKVGKVINEKVAPATKLVGSLVGGDVGNVINKVGNVATDVSGKVISVSNKIDDYLKNNGGKLPVNIPREQVLQNLQKIKIPGKNIPTGVPGIYYK